MNMIKHIGTATLLMLAMTSCGGSSSAAGPATGSSNRDSRRTPKASVVVDGQEWIPESSRAVIRRGALRVTLLTNAEQDGVLTRTEIKLKLAKFDGKGTYAAEGSSMYNHTVVERANQRPREDESKACMLRGAAVEITDVEGDNVRGTFWFKPMPGLGDAGVRLDGGRFDVEIESE